MKAVNVCCRKIYVCREQQSNGNSAALSAHRINDPYVAFRRRTVHDSGMKAYIVGFGDRLGADPIVQADFPVTDSGSAPIFLFSGIHSRHESASLPSSEMR